MKMPRICAALACAALMLAACGSGQATADPTAPAGETAAPVATEAASPAEPTSEASPAPTTAATAEPDAPTATAAAETTPEAAAPTPAAPDAGPVQLEQIADGFSKPLYVASAGDGSGRLFVVEQAGVIKIVRDGQVADQPFLDITDRVGSNASEQGLLSVAFHPQYAENGQLFVDYTDKDGDTVVSRFVAEGDAADPQSEEVLLTVDQPYRNHNGGLVLFGPDGYLYIGLGDGGSGGDPQNRAQNPEELLGKILRIDVDGEAPYSIPADNPLASGGGRPEIWALGLRNPWRFSFDRTTGDMFIGDVGQNKLEEINFQPAGAGGVNYGWNPMEASECYKSDCDTNGYTLPVAEYPHEQGCSVTGGYVYRGAEFPQLQGLYFYADYCSGTVWSLQRDGERWDSAVVLESDARISSFGEDEAGELYVTDQGGTLYRLVAGA